MSENNVCLAVSKFRMNGHLCFLNTRHRISLHSEQIDGTTTVFLHAVIDLHNKILHKLMNQPVQLLLQNKIQKRGSRTFQHRAVNPLHTPSATFHTTHSLHCRVRDVVRTLCAGMNSISRSPSTHLP